jgi:cell division protein FtsB
MVATLNHWLNSPIKVLWLCLGVIFLVLISDGSVFRLWNLHGDQERITDNIAKLERDFQVLDGQYLKVNDPEFLEQQARDRLDLAGEDELIFVFSDN